MALTTVDPECRKKLEKNIEALMSWSKKHSDSYLQALTAICLLNTGEKESASPLLHQLASKQGEEGEVVGAKTSITYSYGGSLLVETTALSVYAWLLQSSEEYFPNITLGLKYIQSRFGKGGYYHTQATVLALQALTKYAQVVGNFWGRVEFVVDLDGGEVGQHVVEEGDIHCLTSLIPNYKLLDFKSGGEHNLGLRVKEPKIGDVECKMSYSLEISYISMLPVPNPNVLSPTISFTFRFKELQYIVGDIAELSVTVANNRTEVMGMTVAILRIPACFEIQHESFEDLKTAQKISHFEVVNANDIYIYWTAIEGNEVKNIICYFYTKFKGKFHGKPSNAYEYYNPDNVAWNIGNLIIVK